jgi:cystathionine gamma-lyase
MKTGGGMITFLLCGGIEESKVFLQKCRLMKCAESLGAVETLIEHPAIMTHASVPPDIRFSLGIKDNLIRMSVGVEDVEDILEDLTRALDSVGTHSRL